MTNIRRFVSNFTTITASRRKHPAHDARLMNRFRIAAVIALTAISPLATTSSLHAQMSSLSGDAAGEFRKLTRAESELVLKKFRSYRAAGDQRMRFVITHAEHRSDDDTRYLGELFITWRDPSGPITRIDIRREGAPATERRSFLIRSGTKEGVFRADAAGAPKPVEGQALTPLLPGLVFATYDLQLPFVRWNDFKYEKTARFRTRPTEFFNMYPPAGYNAVPDIGYVALGFDRQYDALMRAETFNKEQRTIRELRAEAFGKINDQWIIREMKLTDKNTKASDTLTVVSAATRLKLPDTVFNPDLLGDPAPSTPEEDFHKAD